MSDIENELYGGVVHEITQDDIDIRNKIIIDCCRYSAIYNRSMLKCNHSMLIKRIKSNINKLNSHDKFCYWNWFPDYS